MSRWNILLTTLFLTVASLVAWGESITEMKVLSSSSGWAASDKHLYRTSDNGQTWKDITPRVASVDGIAAVFFLDTSTGWALFSQYAEPEPAFDLASTTDAGANWSVTRLSIPRLDPDATTLSGDGRIAFVDRTHGWINLGVVGSSNFRLAVLLATSDGGKTWDWAKGGSGTGGNIRFLTTKLGWVAGGPDGEKLLVTHDGADSWQELSLKWLPHTGLAAQPTTPHYDLPVFQGSQNGFLPVTYVGPEGSGLALVLFSSTDGGQTWKMDRALTQLPEIYDGVPFPSTVADSVLVAAYVSSRTYLTLTTVTEDGKVTTTTANVLPPNSAVKAVSFSTGSQGWVLAGGRLLSTTDGGNTWTEVTPLGTPGRGAPHGRLPSSTSTGMEMVLESPLPSSAEAGFTSIHVGFHKCAAPGTNKMQTWWSSSPLFDAGIYIGGASRGCSNDNLTFTWVTQVRNQGWGLMPVWVGPQAPCACDPNLPPPCTPYPHVFPLPPGAAQAQGSAEADSAAAAASVLGIGGSIIYYDLEFQALDNDLNALERARRSLAERMETLSASKEAELNRLRTQVKNVQAAANPVVPKKVIVDDTEPPKKPAKTAKKKPAPTQPPPASPQ